MEEFYDRLKDQPIDLADYEHARKVWTQFSCSNLEDYMKIYLSADITLLADVMENYRKFFHHAFGLDPTKYISLPGLSYDCMLRYTGCQIDLVHDLKTYTFIKKGLRGGVSMIPHRWAKANNPLLPQGYDPSKPTTHLVYIDCNSLYSSIMTKKLPHRNLRLIEKPGLEWVKTTVKKYTPDDDTGYLIECDLDYPPHIHDLTADLPLAPEHMKISKEHLSPFNLELSKKLSIKMDTTPKLVSTQFDKKNYTCHIENLQFYLQQGLVLRKVHKVLAFEQKHLFKPYIELCITRRREAKYTDEKEMWKLACNSIFGKTITNLERRNTVQLMRGVKRFATASSSPRFKNADLINTNLAQVTSYKRQQLINSPYHIGVVILELSKLHLMKIHYNHFIPTYGIFRLKLCMTDTDSLLYLIETKHLYEELKKMNIIDFSNYPPSNPYHNSEHQGELFLMKDEAGGSPINSFVGLRAKSYSIEFSDLTNKVTGKGIPKHQLQNITHQDLEQTLIQNNQSHTYSKHLRSFKHQVYTINERKVALSAYDNKRHVLNDGIHTLPIGHVDTLLTQPSSKRPGVNSFPPK